MKHDCRLHANASRVDPTRTVTLRGRFEADFTRRFRAIVAEIRTEVDRKDGFGLKRNERFNFPTSQARVEAFMSWLRSRTDFHIFEGTLALPRSVAGQQVWMNTYVQTAYRQGMLEAVRGIRRAGGQVADSYSDGAFLRPVHADRAGQIFIRSYEELQGVTDVMAEQMRRVLSEGILDGRNPNVIARQLVDRVERIGITRARLIARTEVIAAHAEAKLNVFEDAQIEGVGLQSEWLTAGDDRVCDECEQAAREGPYDPRASHGIIPLHPNCRCTWIPLITSGKDIVLQ